MKSPDKSKAAPAARKKYSPPVVRTYGPVRDITRNVGTMAALSDGSGPKSKTA